MTRSQHIKKTALNLGFDACGMARSEPLHKEMAHYKQWLNKGYNAGMNYMHNYPEIRTNPELLIDNAKTVIVTLTNYYPSDLQNPNAPQVAKYAYGRDYHKVLLKKHQQLLQEIQKKYTCKGRIFIDSAPVLERSWAVRAGLGWIGKSSMLISPTIGVHTLISGIVIDLEVDNYDSPLQRDCGKCSKCIEACPTQAIVAPKEVDANKCLSYLTIEHRGPFGKDTHLHHNVFGCDRCIDACPFNKKIPHHLEDLKPKAKLLSMNKDDWALMDEKTYNLTFNGTPVKRAKFEGISRNLNTIKSELF
jgi:epoxyqueuosine reductase